MGGPVPLGYDVQKRKLIINEAEAATVRHIFERYLAHGSLVDAADALAADNIVGNLCRCMSRTTIVNHRQRQQPPNLVCVTAQTRQPSKTSPDKICPQNNL